MNEQCLSLTVLSGSFAICRLPPDSLVPHWADTPPFSSITRTADELSIVCRREAIPEGVQAERDWRCLKVEGPFDLVGAVGVLASLSAALADAGISVFAVSTYDTDYLLVKADRLPAAMSALQDAGHRIAN
jgi:hypothetical protein